MARLCRMGVCQNMFFIGEILSEKYAPKGKFARLGFGLEYSDCVEVEKNLNLNAICTICKPRQFAINYRG